MNQIRSNIWVFLILILATLALFLEHGVQQTFATKVIINLLDFTVLLLFIAELLLRFIYSKYKLIFIKKNIFDLLFLVIFVTLFTYTKFVSFFIPYAQLKNISVKVILARNAFLALKVFSRIKKLNYFLKSFTKNPAQTMVLSFLILILVGTILLMLPYATADKSHLGLINALFTATSAVCVTGLIVVDTATKFSLFGKTVIMFLIQFGGLGIMTFSYFTAYIIGRTISLQEKITLSYMLDEKEMANLSKSIIKIVTTTISIETAGIILLFLKFKETFGYGLKSFYFAVFHSISAFCNAGFALFGDSFESFKSDAFLNFTIAALIILGGLSFVVINNCTQVTLNIFKRKIKKERLAITNLNLNSKVVLVITVILLISGTLVIYGLEHGYQFLKYDLATEYLEAFFQSVTLRTAGFNTINMSALRTPTYLLMIIFMFIGAAAGSTAGGIKVNTVGVIYAYVKSLLKGEENIVIFKNSLSRELVSRAFLIVVLAALTVFIGTFILSIYEPGNLVQILFEVVSAFGTVGLSTGITSSLTMVGKIVITIIMFMGRLGPLTLVAALSVRKKHLARFPEGYINIG